MGRCRSAAAAAWVLVVALTACEGGPSGPTVAGLCVGVVNVGGVFYTHASGASAPAADIGDVHLTISRTTGCLDTGQPADPLAPGESNFLEARTALHRVEGYPAAERLAYWSPIVSVWLSLAPLP
jgi:hypothetical protein